MHRDSLTSLIRRSSGRRHAFAVGLFLVAAFGLSIAFILLRLPGAHTAPWWPAAGFAVLATMVSRGRAITITLALIVTTGLANFMTGSPLLVAIGFGIANGAEAWVVAALMRRRSISWQSFRASDLARFVLAVAAGALTIGAIAGLVVMLEGGLFLVTAPAVAASHASAVLLIAGFGIIPLDSLRPRRPVELLIQFTVLVATLIIAFAPGQVLPLAFVPFPALAWAAFRFSTGIVMIEVVVASTAVAVFGFFGGGPFAVAAVGRPDLLVALDQLFTLGLGISMMLLAAIQDERSALISQLTAREQLLRGTIVSAHAGFLLLHRESATHFRVVESNPTGVRLLADWLRPDHDGTLAHAEVLADTLGSASWRRKTWNGDLELDGRELGIHITPVLDDADSVLVQAIDVSEERRAERALEDALQHERDALTRLRDLNRQKDEFISSVSHELRTPVTSILGYSEELELADLPASERSLLDVITRNSRRLAALVEDLLVLSRMSTQPSIRDNELDLAAAIHDCVRELAPLARQADVALNIRCSVDTIVRADSLWLNRILTNLVSNAIKFTPPGGSIVVQATPHADGTRIAVIDTGRGIPPEEVERVFERFYRVTAQNDGFVPGTGLGLPIVRELVHQLGGDVWLESDGVTGTTATIHLPEGEKPPVNRELLDHGAT